jgi:hypothetical protein
MDSESKEHVVGRVFHNLNCIKYNNIIILLFYDAFIIIIIIIILKDFTNSTSEPQTGVIASFL